MGHRAMDKQTVLITGASAGLGTGFARAFAARGDDLILVARRTDRLNTLAAELSAKHNAQVTVFSTDLTEAGAVAQLQIDIETQGLAVTQLVNNAGYGLRGGFADMDGPSQARMIDLNCRALVELCHAFLPEMIKAGRGGILNIASTAAFQPGPWMAVYYASKAFVLSFSEALHDEVRTKGITVAALCPGATKTEFFEAAQMTDSLLSRYMAGDADKVIRDGMAALDRNRAVAISGALNTAIAQSIRLTPRWLARWIAGSLQKRRGAN
jgi:uncharacterized protein